MEDSQLTLEKGYWISERPFIFQLKKPVENVTTFGKLLKKYFDVKGFPFKVLDYYLLFTDQRVENFVKYWNKGSLIIKLKKPSRLSRLNPFYDEIRSSDTIVIEFYKGKNFFTSYQEAKGEYIGYRFRWKLPLEKIEAFARMLDKFAKADDLYKLLIASVKDENKE